MPHLEELVHRIISIAIPSIKDTQDITRAHSIIFLMTNAVRFALIKIGNCSERSAYSALVLAEVFQGTKIRVGLQSMTRVDHVAVTLGPIAGLYYVYDPFINPEIIIPLKEYQENIYPKLPKSANVLPKIKLTIDGHILEMYKVNKGGIMERIIERINDASADQLWSQSEFRETLSINRYNKEHLNQAREILNIAIEQQKVAVGISPEGSFEL